MPDQLQLRGGTTVQHSTFTGASKEVTVDTTKKTVVVHDGSTAGGNPMLREDASNSALALGSQGTPSLKFTGDTNTGIYSPGADQVAISTGGSGRLFVDASGNVKITSSQHQAISHKNFGNSGSYGAVTIGAAGNNYANVALGIDISGIAGGAFNGNNQVIFPANGALLPNNAGNNFIGVFSRNSSDSILIGPNTSSGITNGPLTVTSTSLGIGTSNPSNKFTIYEAAANPIRLIQDHATSSAYGIEFYSQASTPYTVSSITASHGAAYVNPYLNFNVADTSRVLQTRMVIDQQGRVGIGTASPNASSKLHVADGDIFISKTTGYASLFFNFIGVNTSRAGAIKKNYDSPFDLRIQGGNNAGAAPICFDRADGFENARFDDSGRLLVGTSSTNGSFNSAIQIAGSGVAGTQLISRFDNNAGAPNLYFAKSRGASVGTNTLVQSGDEVGNIGFYAADGTNYVPAAQIRADIDGTPGTNDMPGRLVFSTTADGASSPTERMRITQAGEVLLSTTTPVLANSGTADGFNYDGFNKVLHISRDGLAPVFLRRRTSDGNLVNIYRDTTQVGSISVTTTATAYNTSSDYRLKENVIAVTDGITRLQQLKPSRFNFIADPTKTVDGFIAHEVQTVVPEAITGKKDAVDDEGNPQYQGIDQSKLVPLLTAALQEAVAKIESLEARLTAAGI